jgi:RNA recognition motif-containing protein
MSKPTKVFVGNLAFSTTEQTLAKEFESAGKVTSANIITRGPRSLGYGFVEMESEEAAQNAVRLLNKKEIDGRQINVEVAKPREEGAEGEERKERRPRAARGGFRGTRGRGGFRGGFSGGRGGGRFRRPFYRNEQMEEEEEDDNRPQRSFRRRRGGRGRGARGGSVRRGSENREESKTTLFVANLPFKFDDQAFADVFKQIGLNPKSAHVVTKRNGLSKGYGFVEFNNEADQQKALKEINNKQVEGRDLSVKIALTENPSDDADNSEESTDSKQEIGKETKSSKEEVKEEKKTDTKAAEPKKTAEPAKKTTEAPKKQDTPKAESPKKTAEPSKKATEPPKTNSPKTESKKEDKK